MNAMSTHRIITLTLAALLAWVGFLQAEEAPKIETGKVAADKERITKTVRFLSEENHPRTANPENKKKTIEYLVQSLKTAGLEPTCDEFTVGEQEGTFTNIHALKKGKTDKRIVIGAHYDALQETPGADDNASGIAVLIELANMLKETADMNCGIEFVAYDLEEEGLWGSKRHAIKLKDDKVNVVCMLCVDMVGYYSDEENSQTYPIDAMSRRYGTKGDFLAMIGRQKDTELVADAKKAFQKAVPLKIESFESPELLEFFLTFSDHAPFWQQKYPALLFTDTADLRSNHWHQETDTWKTLDYDRMAQVSVGLYHAILAIDNQSRNL
jgi:Zn-dependent M28 family amino/carboxypeptidase